MDTEYINGQMVLYMKVFTVMMSERVMEFLKLLILKSLRDNGEMDKEKEREC